MKFKADKRLLPLIAPLHRRTGSQSDTWWRFRGVTEVASQSGEMTAVGRRSLWLCGLGFGVSEGAKIPS